MPFHDAQMSDVTVVLDKRWENDLNGACETLKQNGLQVRSADDDNSVVEGSLETCNVHALEKCDCVQYVRKGMTYNAEFPAGDPRDKNQGMGSTPDDEPPPESRRMGKRYP